MNNDTTTYNNTNHEPRPVSVTHLVFGLIFLGVAAFWLTVEVGDLPAPAVSVAAPTILIGAGVIGLLVSLINGSRQNRQHRKNRTIHTHSEES